MTFLQASSLDITLLSSSLIFKKEKYLAENYCQENDHIPWFHFIPVPPSE